MPVSGMEVDNPSAAVTKSTPMQVIALYDELTKRFRVLLSQMAEVKRNASFSVDEKRVNFKF